MSTSKNQNTRAFVFNDEDRPCVITYVHKPNLHVGDKVYLLSLDGTREGPYVIASLPTIEKCTLSLEDGQAIRNGEEIEIDYVEAV